ncbi:hypothetical protein [Geosporobacter ferrireducens]|uniref:Sodium:proton antiporter n=1 Tax=Geosporobacter ferrireducens TaxID=1424294 RepID=A0A1D8GFM0_9FIRM|nr:hypothetical protein [Geosporobacter ferrireducens]AOT69703.1 hypothetical protein Gferi_08985 [Geosporobacter ferrireducens]MTI54589.1 hypothetical protein [Geosporobacter ferrireducens]
MSKKVIVIFILAFLLYAFILALEDFSPFSGVDDAKTYYLSRGFNETGASNLVTAIYLDYRLYDSIFEASLLLATSAGILFLARKEL